MTVQRIRQQLHITQTPKIIASTRLIAPTHHHPSFLLNKRIRLIVRNQTTRQVRHHYPRLIRAPTLYIRHHIREAIPQHLTSVLITDRPCRRVHLRCSIERLSYYLHCRYIKSRVIRVIRQHRRHCTRTTRQYQCVISRQRRRIITRRQVVLHRQIVLYLQTLKTSQRPVVNQHRRHLHVHRIHTGKISAQHDPFVQRLIIAITFIYLRTVQVMSHFARIQHH